jgi:hypothetical protein
MRATKRPLQFRQCEADRGKVGCALPWETAKGPVNGSSTGPSAIWPGLVRRGRHAMGKVSIWVQWLMLAAGVLLSPVFVVFLA